MSRTFDDRACLLGEGPLWHPERAQLLWFDILGKRLLTRTAAGPAEWTFDDMVSAAGWIDRDRLLVASEAALWVFDLESGDRDRVTALEADNPLTRSNDGRADPFGGFWIGTMGKQHEPGAGAVWRYYRGELRRIFSGVTIPNAISFTPDGRHACFADSAVNKVWRVALDQLHGWPKGDPDLFLSFAVGAGDPDGAVFDAAGNFWIAEWGASRVGCYGPDGAFQRAHAVAGRQASCPAFGGEGLADLYVTSARIGLSDDVLAGEPLNGCTFVIEGAGQGQAEHRVVL